ncbi:MAG: cobalamin biosynthesis protein P47K [Planctomycetes bacterium]|nr:cobalamin biosynthesis protein P47K [Planctomycetota bacterium]
MQQKTRFLMIGGFLGAGKTTAIARLARHYTDQGLRVGLVTNDQAYGLVDTETLRGQGFEVGEVPGACFCCKFDDLVDTAAALGADGQPDIILTEPVGSCTDLMATVLRPLGHLFGDRYRLGPLAVLCKPEHGRKILGGGSGGFSPQAAYIFLKQLEEAQLIVLNKVDRLTDDEQAELLRLLHERFPEKKILSASGTTGAGFEDLIVALAADNPLTDQPLDIDYDTYAEGEAALGWLNCGVRFTSKVEWPLDDLVQRLVALFSQTLLAANLEPGHVKVLATCDSTTHLAGELASAGGATTHPFTAIANWVASSTPVELSLASNQNATTANTLINVRVHGDPDTLAQLVKTSVAEVATSLDLTYELSELQHFRPGRPEPQHRYETSTG